MNRERLLLLAEFLETKVPDGQWDYHRIVGDTWKGAQDLSCGTTGCAIGWAASIPELAAAGMCLVIDAEYGPPEAPIVDIDGAATFRNAEAVFDLSTRDALYLFQPDTGLRDSGPLPRTATASEVAAHIRAFVARGGMP